MAHILTVHLLIDTDIGFATDGLNDMFRESQVICAERNDSLILDWAYGAERPISDELEDAIVNETYEEGDFFKEI